MAFDECTSDTADVAYTRAAMERTHRWAVRSLEAHKKNTPTDYKRFIFGIIQGANHRELREQSAQFISSLGFDGIAIGGESIGYNMKATGDILDWVNPFLPADKPHYTMGVGYSPADLFAVVEKGIDMFDCVAPTRIARNGTLFVHKKINPALKININNAQFRADFGPIDPTCTCYTCSTYSRSYLHHLFRTEELLAYRLATLHNVHFFLDLMREMREAIRADAFQELKNTWLN
jgi:tRNA-guanine transglycosylase